MPCFVVSMADVNVDDIADLRFEVVSKADERKESIPDARAGRAESSPSNLLW